MMKSITYLLLCAAAISLTACGESEEDRLAGRCCECLEAESRGESFRDCMGKADYEALGGYDHAGSKEEEFTRKVRERCADVGGDFRL